MKSICACQRRGIVPVAVEKGVVIALLGGGGGGADVGVEAGGEGLDKNPRAQAPQRASMTSVSEASSRARRHVVAHGALEEEGVLGDMADAGVKLIRDRFSRMSVPEMRTLPAVTS